MFNPVYNPNTTPEMVRMSMNYLIASLFVIYVGGDKIIQMKGKTEQDTMSQSTKIMTWISASILSAGTMNIVWNTEMAINDVSKLCLMLIALLSSLCMYIDMRVKIIPNMLLLPMLIFATIFHILNGGLMAVLSGVVALFIAVYGLIGITKLFGYMGQFGAGDIKMFGVGMFLFATSFIGMMGMLCGFIASMFLLVGSLLATKQITLKSMMPFGPFIGIGMIFGIIAQTYIH